MTDPILLFLALDIAALFLVGASCGVIPRAAGSFLTTILAGLGVLLCLPPLLLAMPATEELLPFGPPNLALHLVLDPLAAVFLLLIFLGATATAAFQATTRLTVSASPERAAAFCTAGTALMALAGDAVSLSIGAAVGAGAVFLHRGTPRAHPVLLVPLLLLAAIGLLDSGEIAANFQSIRAGSIEPWRGPVAAALATAAVIVLIFCRSTQRCPTRDALAAGTLTPAALYLLLRIVVDLCGPAPQSWWGLTLLLIGGTIAVAQAWTAAGHATIDGCMAALIRRQAGLGILAIGLITIAHVADLPQAQAPAMAAIMLLAIGGSVGGVLTTLCVHTIGVSAATYRLSRLGGLAQTMPWTAVALGVGLLALSALPPGIGFAALWLLLQSVLSAPGTGGLLAQLPLALAAAAVALSAATATAASIRLVGIALLGRPRSPRGAAARDIRRPTRFVLLTLAGMSLLPGVLPGALSGPPIQVMATPASWLATADTFTPPTYPAAAVTALVAAITSILLLARRWRKRDRQPTGPYIGGMTPPFGLPFGEPVAQAGAAGFLPKLPDITLPALPRLPQPSRITAAAGLWMILAAIGLGLLALAMIG